MGKNEELDRLAKASIMERQREWQGVNTIAPKKPKKAAPRPEPGENKRACCSIEVRGRKAEGKIYPRIVLNGKWLTEAGFVPGIKVRVRTNNNQIIINKE